ncbi:MAG: 5-oxoprolinase subunit PxpB [Bacteroidetes bacterium]|jgi:inhibitor of KinA|nr:5-oxoprolinase subunit PxpB [Bacteroidota bacterium]
MSQAFNKYKIYFTSPRSLIIEWEFDLSPKYIRALQVFKSQVLSEDKDIQFITSAFKSMLVNYRLNNVNISDKKKSVEKQLNRFKEKDLEDTKSRLFKIPVCYNGFGLDLQHISNQTKLNQSEIIKLHTGQVYTLYFIGFLPGFLYLGDVDKRIQMPRHQKPRPKVEKGSVGIAENQTGIYPMSSPGGWQIIGQTPINLFNVDQNPPSPFQPGDKIQFYAIDQSEFERLNNSEISIQKFNHND